jgi:outer membrane protein assembly factor BamB
MADKEKSDEGPVLADKKSARPPQRPKKLTGEGFRFPWICLCLWIVTAIVLSTGWYFRSEYDSALFSFAFVISVGISSIFTFFWFVFFSGIGRLWRYLAGVIVISCIGVAAYAFNVERVDFGGSMVPARMQFDLGANSMVVITQPEFRISFQRPEKIGELKLEKAEVSLAGTDTWAFPQFLGPDGRNYLPDTEINEDWSVPPEELWSIPIGLGWSGFAAKNGFAVTLEQRDEDEFVTCYRISDGSAVWATPTKARHDNDIPGGIGPRSTPSISEDGRVYALGGTGILRCLRGEDGMLVWEQDLIELAGSNKTADRAAVKWGRANSPLILNDICIAPLGGMNDETVSLVALDRLSGEVKWKQGTSQISYATPVLGELHGELIVLVTNESSVSGHDAETGEELWQFPWDGSSSSSANNTNPVVLPGNRVLISKGYGVGAAVWQINLAGGKWSAEQDWSARVLRTKFTNPIVKDGYGYGLSDGILECVRLEDGKRMWKRGRYGHGQTLGVGKHILVMAENGEVALVQLQPKEFEEVASFAALDAKTWNNVCVYGDKLLVRNAEEARCYQLPVVSMPEQVKQNEGEKPSDETAPVNSSID